MCGSNTQIWKQHMFQTLETLTGASQHAAAHEYEIDNTQTAIANTIINSICACDEHYDTNSYQLDSESDHASEHDEIPGIAHDMISYPSPTTCDWKNFSYHRQTRDTKVTINFLCHQTKQCIEEQRKILLTAPTGILASAYKNLFGEDITTETVHAAFEYPVKEEQHATTNWSMSLFDLVVIDGIEVVIDGMVIEVSMIPVRIFEHVIQTLNQLPVRPVVVLAGDEKQQQPIETINGKIVQVDNILTQPKFSCASLLL